MPRDAAAAAEAGPARPDAAAGSEAAGSEAAGSEAVPAPPDAALRIARNETRETVLASRVAVGDSLWGKFWGLMGRRSLPDGEALWLPQENGIHMFFMRFPIDAIFVGRPAADGSRGVLSLHRALRPWTGIVPLIRGADGVLELPSGVIEASGTELGDAIRID